MRGALHQPRTRFSHAQLLYSHLVTDFTHLSHASSVAQESRSTLLVSFHKTLTLHRAMSYVTLHLMTPGTDAPSSLVLNPFFSEHKPCGDLRPQLSGTLAEPRPVIGYEPKQLAENKDHRHFTEDKQLTEHEDFRVKRLSFHQSTTASTYDPAESIATPLPESDLDDEQLRALLASPLYSQEREPSAERSQVYHSEHENLMSSSSQDPTSTGKSVALLSSQNRLNQETFTDGGDLPVNVAKSLLDGIRDHSLAEARSELMKLKDKVESLNTCISELQRQTYSQWLELEDAFLICRISKRASFDCRKKWS